MTLVLIATAAILAASGSFIAGLYLLDRWRFRRWKERYLNGLPMWQRIPDRAYCSICTEEIEAGEKTDYIRMSICHASCYEKQEKK